MASGRPVRIGLLGFGTVGRGVYDMLTENSGVIHERAGLPLEVVRIGVRDPRKERGVDSALITTDLDSIIEDPSIDVVIEVMGGLDPAHRLLKRALENGKSVVTANKELMAKSGSELLTLAAERNLDLEMEAAVGGGIPLIQPLKHQLSGNDMLRMVGILNGTTNFILSKMEEGGEAEAVLAEAQALGYAEADPSSDIDGFDTAYKIAILASLAWGQQILPEQVAREGMRHLARRDIEYAAQFGYRVKLLGLCDPVGDLIRVRVHPAFVPTSHPLASITGVYNGLWFKGDFVGSLLFSGRGAGGNVTASAVVGDLIGIVRNLADEGKGSAMPYGPPGNVAPMEDLVCPWYFRLIVENRPRTLGEIAQVFGLEDISIRTLEMQVLPSGQGEIALLTHEALESKVQAAQLALRSEPGVISVAAALRIEELN